MGAGVGRWAMDGMSDVYIISSENMLQLAENVINDAQPVIWQSCDWLGCVPPPLIYPLIVYRQIERLRDGYSSSK
jgi:hypothetical protein